MVRFVSALLAMTTLSRLLAGLCLSIAAGTAFAQTPTGPNTGLPVTDLTIGMYKVHAEVPPPRSLARRG